tara:strand:- start:163 stop:546 length:384 start_codon:yes stop_codon:yes gene_type:complete
MKSYIDIKKLKRNTKILLETEKTIFEIVVTGPKTSTVSVHGGIHFPRQTKAVIFCVSKARKKSRKISHRLEKGIIRKGDSVQFVFEDKKSLDSKEMISSGVLSATIFASDDSWKYDAIEKDSNEDTN